MMHFPLPADYRIGDVLKFHGRDTESTAERISANSVSKGVMFEGQPLLLEVRFADGVAHCSDAPEAMLRNILGLHIDPAPFAAKLKRDKVLGPLVRSQPGMRIMQSATVFEALTWAIIGQQINLSFAIALRRTFILQAGRQHDSGLCCYPEAADVARLDVETLTERKFSRAKAETLLRLARLVAEGELDLAPSDDIAAVCARLLAVKGIGPWTVNYALLRGYAYPDCSLHGDVAIRAALQTLLGLDAKPSIADTEAWLAQYAPHRTMAAAHLWASLNKTVSE